MWIQLKFKQDSFVLACFGIERDKLILIFKCEIKLLVEKKWSSVEEELTDKRLRLNIRIYYKARELQSGIYTGMDK